MAARVRSRHPPCEELRLRLRCRFVVDHWHTSPLGPITDVMWARPDGERVLLAPTPEVAAFVGGVYGFDRVEIVDISVTFDGRRLALEAHLRPTGPGNTPSAR